MDKILPPKKLLSKLKAERRSGRKIVFTNGCFDLVHIGHIRLLQKASCLGDVLVVALNSDGSARKLKGNTRPIVSLRDRMEIIAAIQYVSYVTSFNEQTPQKIIKYLSPDVLVKGGDYESDEVVGGREVLKSGGKVVIIPFVKGKSTSRIYEKICSG